MALLTEKVNKFSSLGIGKFIQINLNLDNQSEKLSKSVCWEDINLAENLGDLMKPSEPDFGYPDQIQYDDYTITGVPKRYLDLWSNLL